MHFHYFVILVLSLFLVTLLFPYLDYYFNSAILKSGLSGRFPLAVAAMRRAWPENFITLSWNSQVDFKWR